MTFSELPVDAPLFLSFSISTSIPTPYFPPTKLLGCHFLARLPDAVILLVVIRSPIYFCKNLLWLSSLSCSSLTASIRLKSVTRESCRALACLHPNCQPSHTGFSTSNLGGSAGQTHRCSSSLASFPNVSISSLVLLGLMALTSSGPTCISIGPTADESRGTIMVPLLLRLGRGGRTGMGAWMVGCWSSDDDESDQSGLGDLCGLASPIMD